MFLFAIQLSSLCFSSCELIQEPVVNQVLSYPLFLMQTSCRCAYLRNALPVLRVAQIVLFLTDLEDLKTIQMPPGPDLSKKNQPEKIVHNDLKRHLHLIK